MRTRYRNFIIFMCIIKLALSACEESPEIVVMTTQEVTTEVLKELNNIEESTTLKLDLDVLPETTTVTINFEELIHETTTTDATGQETTTTDATGQETTTTDATGQETTTTDATGQETTTIPSVKEITTQNTIELLESLETTTTPVQELTTPPSVDFGNYAVKQMNFVLDHILQTSYDFVSQVLQESDNSFNQRDKLKRYAELLHHILKDSSEAASYNDHSTDDSYNAILKKWAFLKGKGTKYLHKYLPNQWLQSYTNNKQDISMWLDKTSEQMHEEFNTFISEEEDQVKFQYFNEAFDDIPRANEIHQKLTILADLVKIATNKKQISFMDLYMQS